MSSHTQTSNRRGVVLIVVLVLVVMIALAGFGFVRSMSTEYEATKTSGDSRQAEQALLSAEVYVQRYLKLPRIQREEEPDSLTARMEFRAIPLSANTGGLEELDAQAGAEGWQFSIVAAALASEIEEGTANSQAHRFGLENESNKLNLAAIAAWDRIRPGAGRATLLKFPGMTPQIADAILDWIDADTLPREFGAESEFYAELPQPYRVANRLPGSLEELLLVRGVTRELLFGADRNRNFRIDEDEQPPTDTESTFEFASTSVSETAAWCDLLTLHSAERTDSPSGSPRINLNNPDLASLQSELLEVFPTDIVNFVLLYRQHGPSNPTTSISAGGISVALSAPARVGLKAVSDLINVKVTVPGEPPIGVISPFTHGTIEMEEWLGVLLTETTTNANRVTPARLNINSAPDAVIRAVPFLSEETIESILAQRPNLEPAGRHSVAWLLTEDIVSPGTFKQLEPWLTAGGDVFQCQLIVFRGSHGPIRRVQAVFDGASPKPRRVEWRDLRSLGNGFSRREVSREMTDTESAMTRPREL